MSTAARTERASESVQTSVLISYALPVVGLSGPLFIVQFYFLNFATDVLLLSPFAVGLVFAAGRVWDAISDPIIGTLSDRTHTRLGRRRPWMIAGIPLFALTFVTIWSPPEIATWATYAWLTVALFAFYTAFTMISVPHAAWGAELSTNHHERSRIFGAHSASFTLGIFLAFAAIQYLMNAADPRAAAFSLSLAIALAAPLVLLIPPLRLRERDDYQGRGAASSTGAIRDVLANPHARQLLFVNFCQLMGSGVVGLMAPYFLRYVMNRPDLVGVMPAAFVLSSVIAIPFWLWVSRRTSKKTAWVAGLFGSGLAFGGVLFVSDDAPIVLGVLLAIAGFFNGCGMMVGNSILADVIDWDELKTGQRKEGAYSAAWGFAIKSATAVNIILVSGVLQLSDFQANVVQTEGTIWILRLLNGGIPLVMFALAGLLCLRFGLNEAEHKAVREQLDARQSD